MTFAQLNIYQKVAGWGYRGSSRAKKKLTTEEYLDSVGDESDALAK